MSVGALPPRHVAVGNVNVDVYFYVDRLPSVDDVISVEEAVIGLGGAAANYSVAVARAGHRSALVAHTTRHVKALGLLDSLVAEGVDVSHVRVHDDGMPGLVVVLVLPSGEVSMLKIRGVNKLLKGDEVAEVLPMDVVHFASVEPSIVDNACRATKGFREATIVSYDPGGAVVEKHASGIIEVSRRCVTLLTLNARELELVAGSRDYRAAKRLLGGRLAAVLVRIGGGGAYLVTVNAVYQVYGFHYGRVVDTTGAGDTFNAYFNTYLAEGRSYEEALEAASIAAGVKVTRKGAQTSPRRSEVELLKAKVRARLARRLEQL